MENNYIIILVTTRTKNEAESIAKKLLEEKLIACANIVGPVTSHFHWSGKLDYAEEYLMLMKSRLELFETLSSRVKELHSYEVPEVLALPIVKGSASYLDWLAEVLK